jgi:cell division protease FtsH
MPDHDNGSKRERPRPSSGSAWGPWFPLALLALGFVFARSLTEGDASPEISYSRFRAELEQDNVASVVVSGQEIRGRFDEPVSLGGGGDDRPDEPVSRFKTYGPAVEDPSLVSELLSGNREVVVQPASDAGWWVMIATFGPFLLLGLVILYGVSQMRSRAGGLFSMGQSRAKLYHSRREEVKFDDVAGAKGAKRELVEIVDFLRDPSRMGRLGAHMPKGLLLVGPPGTGKTLLARATAGEAAVPFFTITGSDFMEMFVGVGASRVRDMFAQAKNAAPSIIFIDELDSIGRRRGAGLGGGHDEREQTLNQLLSEMDGFEPNEGVIVMAATNRPDILDPALMRPGRFDRRVEVELPASKDRLAILKVHTRNKPVGDDVKLEEIARSTPGFSGADLENLVNEAALLAARGNEDVIQRVDVERARDRIVMGLERENLALTQEECELLAYHEAGHAIVAAALPHADRIHKVTIVPRGRSMGHTEQLPEGDRYVYDKAYLLDRLAVMMGGRAAEVRFRQTETSGAEEDLKRATRLARKMVLAWGMGEGFSRIAFSEGEDEVFLGRQVAQQRDYSEDTAREIDTAVRVLLDDAYARAENVLEEHESVMDRLVPALVEREEITGDEIQELMMAVSVEEPSAAGVEAVSK